METAPAKYKHQCSEEECGKIITTNIKIDFTDMNRSRLALPYPSIIVNKKVYCCRACSDADDYFSAPNANGPLAGPEHDSVPMLNVEI